MTHKSTTHRRLFTCILVVALLVATFIASTFTTSANTTVLEGVELKLGHTIGFVYYSKQEYTENTVMRFEINGRITDVPAIPNDQTCAFVFNDIYPHELAHEIKTTIFVDGKPVVSYPAFSMREYLLSELLKIEDPNDPHCKLVSNLLQYGEATREYRNANVDASERDDVEILDFDMSIYTTYNPDNLNTLLSETANNLGVSTNDIHLSSIGISYYNTNKYVVTLVIPDDVSVPMEKIMVSIDNVEYRMDDDTNSNIKNPQPGVYEIYSDPIHANEVFNYSPVIKLSVNGNEVQNISYSCKDYVLHLQQLEPNTLAENYAQALYYYGEWASKVYQNPTVIALGPLKKPDDIMLKNSQPHQPTGGLGAAYMSDGSIQEVELEWGFVEAITDDTYKVEREVVGQYEDSITGRVYSAKSTVTLLNPLKEIQRWTDPSNITPDINATEYIINDAEVKAIWSNGYSEVRTANPYTLTNIAYERCLTACKPISIQYTDPKSNVTCTLPEPVFLYIDNPIISISTEQTSSLLFANTSGSIYVDKSSFICTITQASGYSFTTTAADLMSNWKVSTNTPVYKGNDETGTITVNWRATFRYPDGWIVEGQYKNGQVQPDYTLQAHQPINWSCEAEFYNPITEIELTGDPSCTLTSTELPTSENKMLSGGIVIAYRANGASEKLANSLVQYAAEATIIDTTYSKEVVYVATYQGLQDSGIITITNPIKENSLVQDPNGKMHVYASSWDQTYTTAYPEHFSEGLKVTYANGVTANVTPTAFDVGENAGEEMFYTHNIQDTSRISELYTDGGWTSKTLTTGKGIVKGLYTDDRAGVTNASTMTCELHYYVVNEPKGATKNYPTVLAENYTNQYLANRKATIEVILMNGYVTTESVWLEQIENIQNEDEYALKQCDIYYSTPYYTMTSGSYGVYVYNPADEINFVKADPSPIQVTDTNAITSSAIEQSPGLLEVTLHNDKKKLVKPQSFTGLENVKITDKTIAKQFDIIAHYQTQEYEDATKLTTEGLTRPVKLILKNEPKTANITLKKGSETDPITLINGAVQIEYTTNSITYNNGNTIIVTPTKKEYLYPNGILTGDSAANTNETGYVDVTVSLPCTASATFEMLNDDGEKETYTVSASAMNKTLRVHWINEINSIAVDTFNCTVADKNIATVTPTVTVNVNYKNGASASKTPTNVESVGNITTFAASDNRETTITYKAEHGQVKELTYSFILYNPIVDIRYPKSTSESSYFKETKLDDSSSTTVSNVYAIYRANGRWSSVGGTHKTYPDSWLNMDLSSNNSAISFTKDNSISPTVTYTGTSVAVTLTCTATLNSNAITTPYDEVTTCTHTITLHNPPVVSHPYSSTPSSTKTKNFNVLAWSDTNPTLSVTLDIYGENGAFMCKKTFTATNILKNCSDTTLYMNQTTNVATNYFSTNVCKSIKFNASHGGYSLSPIISCYVSNPVEEHIYYPDTVVDFKRKTSGVVSNGDFTIYRRLFDVYHTGTNLRVAYIMDTPYAGFYFMTSSKTDAYIKPSTLNRSDVAGYTSATANAAFDTTKTRYFAVRLVGAYPYGDSHIQYNLVKDFYFKDKQNDDDPHASYFYKITF